MRIGTPKEDPKSCSRCVATIVKREFIRQRGASAATNFSLLVYTVHSLAVSYYAKERRRVWREDEDVTPYENLAIYSRLEKYKSIKIFSVFPTTKTLHYKKLLSK